MDTPFCEVVALGDFSPWAKQLLNEWQTDGILRIQFEKSISHFCSSPTIRARAEVAILENSPAGRSAVNQIRSSNKKVLLILLGEHFSKEDLSFSLKQRAFGVIENAVRTDKESLHLFHRAGVQCNDLNQLSLVLQNLKGLFIQAESEIKDSALATEMKVGLGKIEKFSSSNEFFNSEEMADTQAVTSLPLAKSQTLGEVLLTISELERTGTLWIRGGRPNQEGKVDFIQGKITAAEAGSVNQLKAIYRMFLWEGARFLFNRKNVEDFETKELIPLEMSRLVQEGEEQFRRFQKVQKEVPPVHLELDIEPHSIQVATEMTPVEFHALVQVVEYHHLSDVLDYSPLWDVDVYESLIRLRKAGHIKVR